MTNRIRYCDECQCDREVRVVERENTLMYGNENFNIMEIFAQCTHCNAEVTDEELDTFTLTRLRQAYELKHSFDAQGIKNLRLHFGLTMNVFAKILNIGYSTLKRYESSGSSPDVTQIGIFKLLKAEPTSILKFYEVNKFNLTIDEQRVAESKFQQLFASPDNSPQNREANSAQLVLDDLEFISSTRPLDEETYTSFKKVIDYYRTNPVREPS